MIIKNEQNTELIKKFFFKLQLCNLKVVALNSKKQARNIAYSSQLHIPRSTVLF